MKLLDKIKNAIFEEEEIDEEFQEETPKKKIVRDDTDEEIRRKFRRKALEERFKAEAEQKQKEEEVPLEDELVKQIDVEKTIPKRVDAHVEEEENLEKSILEQPVKEFPKRESRRAPIIFDDEDFDDSVEEVQKPKPVLENKKTSKTLYGGYRDDGTKEKFKPSPNISPVYGLVEVSPVLNKENHKAPKENHVYVPKKQDGVSLDEVRQKAFGNEPYFEEDEDLGLLYDMKEDDKPVVSKVTLGDAEEYFDDLGLEYNVDYTDKKPTAKTSRAVKNEELSNKVTKEIENEEEQETETLEQLEITKEQIKPRTAEEIKKIKKIENADLDEKDKDKAEEKNLYDLIDMMYDSE